MAKNIFTILLICLSSSIAFAQIETKTTAPVKWERYKFSDENLSLMLPKMPVVFSGVNICEQLESRQFMAYADENIYSFTIMYKSAKPFPAECKTTKKFGEASFSERLEALHKELRFDNEDKTIINNLETLKFESSGKTYWIIKDLKNLCWYELWIGSENLDKAEIEKFVESIQKERGFDGIEINDGAKQILGDENIPDGEVFSADENTAKTDEIKPLKLFFKPRAIYTEVARQRLTVGNVRLKVTFLASGGIGAVTVVSDPLKYGLTEQAIEAARRIAFVPQKVNNKPVSVVRQLEYSFNIF